ncbi:MAG: hypothetical protein QOI41_2511, partial [Myxococcales bacterium]|nr:hypothetical protein [Myxococcales bacterium]
AVSGGVCGRCGNTSGESNRCPHCNAIARVEPKGSGASLTWVCGVCGGPRMPQGAGGEAAAQPLREARASQRRALRGRAQFWAFTVIALFFTLVAVAAWPVAAFVSHLILLAMATAPTLVAVRARSRAHRADADANEALERAWLAAAEDVTSHAKKGVTVAELAARLKIDAVKAEKLLTELAVHDRTRIDVDDDAEVRYSIAPELQTSKEDRVRVDATEEQFRALEEAELDEAEQKKLATPAFPRGSR